MRANEFLTESQVVEMQNLQEGPLGSLVKAAGTGIGKLAGGLAKGVGAVAGGVAGMGSAFKKGFQSGKKTVAAGGDDPEADTPAATTTKPAAADTSPAPAAGGAPASSTAAPASTPASTPASSTTAPAEPAAQQAAASPTATAKPAAAPAPAAAAKPAAKDTDYSKALKAVTNLPDEQKKEIIAMLQKDPKVVAAMNRPAKEKPAGAAKSEPGKGLSPDAFGKMAKDLLQPGKEKPAPTGSSAGIGSRADYKPATTATPKKTGGKVAGQLSQTPDAIRKREARAKAKTQKQAEIEADRDRVMGTTTDSIIRKQPSLVEGFSLFRR